MFDIKQFAKISPFYYIFVNEKQHYVFQRNLYKPYYCTSNKFLISVKSISEQTTTSKKFEKDFFEEISRKVEIIFRNFTFLEKKLTHTV